MSSIEASSHSKVFMRWIDLSIGRKVFRNGSLYEDLDNGVILIELLLSLSPDEAMPGRYYSAPFSKSQKIQNLNVAFDFITEVENITLTDIKPTDIFQKNKDAIDSLMLTLILHYSLQYPPSSSISPHTFLSQLKGPFLAWINSILPGYQVTNFHTDWRDGRVLSALTNYCFPNSIPKLASLLPENANSNVRFAMAIAEKNGVAQLIEMRDVVTESPDELSIFLYASQFIPHGERILLQWIRQQILGGIEALKTIPDWDNGKFLGALVHVTSGGKFEAFRKMDGTDDDIQNIEKSMHAAETILGIHRTIEATELADLTLNPIPRLSYLAQFYFFKVQGRIPLPSTKDMASHSIFQPKKQKEIKIPVGKGLKLKVKEQSRFKMEEVKAEVNGEATGPGVIDMGKCEDGSFEIRFNPPKADHYVIAMKLNGKEVRMFHVHYFDAPDHPAPASSMDTLNKSIDLSSMAEGSFDEVETTGQDKAHLSLENYVKYSGNISPRSFRKSQSFDSHDSGRSVTPTFHIENPGQGELTAFCYGETKGIEIPVEILQASPGSKKHMLKVKPKEPDLYHIHVKIDGVDIKMSPFTVDLRKTVRRRVSETPRLGVEHLRSTPFFGSDQILSDQEESVFDDSPLASPLVKVARMEASDEKAVHEQLLSFSDDTNRSLQRDDKHVSKPAEIANIDMVDSSDDSEAEGGDMQVTFTPSQFQDDETDEESDGTEASSQSGASVSDEEETKFSEEVTASKQGSDEPDESIEVDKSITYKQDTYEGSQHFSRSVTTSKNVILQSTKASHFSKSIKVSNQHTTDESEFLAARESITGKSSAAVDFSEDKSKVPSKAVYTSSRTINVKVKSRSRQSSSSISSGVLVSTEPKSGTTLPSQLHESPNNSTIVPEHSVVEASSSLLKYDIPDPSSTADDLEDDQDDVSDLPSPPAEFADSEPQTVTHSRPVMSEPIKADLSPASLAYTTMITTKITTSTQPLVSAQSDPIKTGFSSPSLAHTTATSSSTQPLASAQSDPIKTDFSSPSLAHTTATSSTSTQPLTSAHQSPTATKDTVTREASSNRKTSSKTKPPPVKPKPLPKPNFSPSSKSFPSGPPKPPSPLTRSFTASTLEKKTMSQQSKQKVMDGKTQLATSKEIKPSAQVFSYTSDSLKSLESSSVTEAVDKGVTDEVPSPKSVGFTSDVSVHKVVGLQSHQVNSEDKNVHVKSATVNTGGEAKPSSTFNYNSENKVMTLQSRQDSEGTNIHVKSATAKSEELSSTLDYDSDNEIAALQSRQVNSESSNVRVKSASLKSEEKTRASSTLGSDNEIMAMQSHQVNFESSNVRIKSATVKSEKKTKASSTLDYDSDNEIMALQSGKVNSESMNVRVKSATVKSEEKTKASSTLDYDSDHEIMALQSGKVNSESMNVRVKSATVKSEEKTKASSTLGYDSDDEIMALQSGKVNSESTNVRVKSATVKSEEKTKTSSTLGYDSDSEIMALQSGKVNSESANVHVKSATVKSEEKTKASSTLDNNSGRKISSKGKNNRVRFAEEETEASSTLNDNSDHEVLSTQSHHEHFSTVDASKNTQSATVQCKEEANAVLSTPGYTSEHTVMNLQSHSKVTIKDADGESASISGTIDPKSSSLAVGGISGHIEKSMSHSEPGSDNTDGNILSASVRRAKVAENANRDSFSTDEEDDILGPDFLAVRMNRRRSSSQTNMEINKSEEELYYDARGASSSRKTAIRESIILSDDSTEQNSVTRTFQDMNNIRLEGKTFKIDTLYSLNISCIPEQEITLDMSCDAAEAADTTTFLDHEKRVYICTLLPKKPGNYNISVKQNHKEVTGSPFRVKFIEDQVFPNMTFSLGTGNGVEVSNVTASMKNKLNQKQIPTYVTQVDEAQFSLDFVAASKSKYVLSIRCLVSTEQETYLPDSCIALNNVQPAETPPSPATSSGGDIAIPTVGQVKFPTSVEEGRPIQFSFRPGFPLFGRKMKVTATPKSVTGSHRVAKDGMHHCTVPTEHPGKYIVEAKWEERRIQGTPFEVNVYQSPRPDKVKVFGMGISSGKVGKLERFTIDTTGAGYGTVATKVIGYDPIFTVHLERDPTCVGALSATYRPQAAGTYTLHVMFQDVQVPGSPFTVVIT